MTTVAIVVALAATVVGVALFTRAAVAIVGVVRLGRPLAGRRDQPGDRWRNLLSETLGHTRMLQWTGVGVAHWFVFVAFGALFFTLVTAYGQLFDPRFALPVIGHWMVYEWASEIIAWADLIGIAGLDGGAAAASAGRGPVVAVLRLHGPGRASSSSWSSWASWSACLTLRALEYRCSARRPTPVHFPLTWFLLPAGLRPSGAGTRRSWWSSAVKIVISMAWFVVLGLNTTMGVAWHRFTVWPNIWFKREAPGRPALGALQPIMVDGKPLDFPRNRGPRRGRRARRRQGRGLHLEGSAGLHLLHRVRPLPVPVPGLEHREAAVAQAADHGPARPRLRQGALPAGGRGGAGVACPRRSGPRPARPLVGPIQADATGWPA